MLSEPMTLYKLMNLYMLKKVNFPLTNAQLTDFFLQHEYASYFTLQQALGELKDSGLIHAESTHSTTRYEITREGEETLTFFENNISPGHHRGYGHLFKRKPSPAAQRGQPGFRLLQVHQPGLHRSLRGAGRPFASH